MESLSRRALLQYGALGVLTTGTTEAPAAPTQPIIDTHQHLWDFKKYRPPWVKDEPKLNQPFAMKEYLVATKGLNIVKTIYMEVDVAEKDENLEADYITEMCRRGDSPLVAAVVSGRPASPAFKNYVRRFKGNPYIKGVRQVLQVPSAPKGLCLQPEFVRSVQLLGEMGLTFDICIRPTELADGIKLADACPGTRFILDHCGNASARDPHREQWKRDIAEFSQRKNVVCKVSGIVKTIPAGSNPTEELRPIVLHVVKSFGAERVMFGGDWPVCNLASSFRGWVTALKEILHEQSVVDQRKLFHDNAMRFYGLK